MPAAVALAARSALSSKYSASASGEAPPRLIRSHPCSLPPACGSRGTANALKRIESTQIKRKMSTASPARGWITCTSTCTVATHQSLPACCKDSPLSPLSHTRTKYKSHHSVTTSWARTDKPTEWNQARSTRSAPPSHPNKRPRVPPTRCLRSNA